MNYGLILFCLWNLPQKMIGSLPIFLQYRPHMRSTTNKPISYYTKWVLFLAKNKRSICSDCLTGLVIIYTHQQCSIFKQASSSIGVFPCQTEVMPATVMQTIWQSIISKWWRMMKYGKSSTLIFLLKLPLYIDFFQLVSDFPGSSPLPPPPPPSWGWIPYHNLGVACPLA